MATLKSPSDLLKTLEQKRVAQVTRVTDSLNSALSNLTQYPFGNTISDMLVLGVYKSDAELICKLMTEAGYSSVRVKAFSAGRNETGIKVSFSFPPQTK